MPELNTDADAGKIHTNFYLSQFIPDKSKKSFPLSVISLILGSFSFLLLMGAYISYLNIYTVFTQAVVAPLAIIFGLFARKKEPNADRGIWGSGIRLALATIIVLAIYIIVPLLVDQYDI